MSNRTIAWLLALCILLCFSAFTACTANPPIAATEPDLQETVSNIVEVSSEVIETTTASTAVDTGVLTVERLEQLTWVEMLELNWVPESDEDRCLNELITSLQMMGEIFRPTTACTTSDIPIEAPGEFDLTRLNEKVNIIMEVFNASPSTYWYVDFITINPQYHFFPLYVTSLKLEIRSEEFDLKYPVEELGELVVAINDVHCYSAPESFGKYFDSCLSVMCDDPDHTIKAGDIVVVNGVAMLETFGDLKASTYVEFGELNDADTPIIVAIPTVHMVHICTTDGTKLGWAHPDNFIPQDVAGEYIFPNE